MKESVFADTDICLDLLTGRQPHYNAAAKLFTIADQKKSKFVFLPYPSAITDELLKSLSF